MSSIVDQFGQSIRASALMKTPANRAGDFKQISPPRPKTFEAILAWQRRELVDISRVIASGVTNIDTALTQAGEFSVGDSWHLKSRGGNKSWGKKRDAWFNEIYARDCNLRGEQNDWRSTLRQLVWTRKVHGDYGIIFDGQPYRTSEGKEIAPTGKFHVITYDRIGTGLNVSASVGGGLDQVKELGNNWLNSTYPTLMVGFYGMYIINDPNSLFDGERIIDGVIVDANMRLLGYRINGFNGEGKAVYVDVPKGQIHVNFGARKMPDLVRGIPELAEAIVPTLHLDDIQDMISMAVKLASALAITRKSSDGAPMRGGRVTYDETETQTDGSEVRVKRAVEEIFPGIIELAANNKEELGVLAFDRPSMNEEAFTARVETAVLHKLWPRSLIYSADAGRAGTRSIAVQANTICQWDQICVERSARWISNRATEFGMRTGQIPENRNLAEPYDYVFTVPGKFTVDEGNDMKMRLLALGRCCISRGQIVELEGYLAEEIEEQREAEVDRVLSAAKRLQGKHSDFTVKEIAFMLDNSDRQLTFSEQEREEQVDMGADLGKPDKNRVPADGTEFKK